jgi:hypothetical protein
MQAESQDDVWYNLDSRPSRPCTFMQFGTLELMRNVWTPFECYLIPIGIFGHSAFRVVFLRLWRYYYFPPPRLHVHQPLAATSGGQ